MIAQKLIDYLDQNHVPYDMISHPVQFTAQRTAAAAHIKGRQFMKSVLLKIDNDMMMAVVPAGRRVNIRRIKEISGARDVVLADETDLEAVFPDCIIGAMPPFGNLYHMPVIADRELTEDEEVVFNAGDHRDLIRMRFTDWNRLVHPRIADLHG